MRYKLEMTPSCGWGRSSTLQGNQNFQGNQNKAIDKGKMTDLPIVEDKTIETGFKDGNHPMPLHKETRGRLNGPHKFDSSPSIY